MRATKWTRWWKHIAPRWVCDVADDCSPTIAVESTLEQLLRATKLTHGRIALNIMGDGRWSAVICHFNGHMTHPMGEDHEDPVVALRAALFEDERKGRDLERRYRAASKVGDTPAPQLDPLGDMEDLLG